MVVFYLASLCLVFENKPFFIFLVTATKEVSLLNEFRIGKELENLEEFLKNDTGENGQKIKYPLKYLKQLKVKKSAFLASLLEQRSSKDIPYEDFYCYDRFMEDTLEVPDEVYTERDRDGDDLFTYIKAHEKDGKSFYYFVICMNIGPSMEEAGDTILTYPWFSIARWRDL